MAYQYALALTGSIATGKSTVASLLKLHGIAVIDADAIAHELLEKHISTIETLFGSEYICNGKVDRAALGKLIFSDVTQKEKLETFMHPLIQEEIEKRSEKQDKFKIPYLIDIPLFFEKNNYEAIKESVVVYTPFQTQLKRLIKRNGYSEEEAKQRIASQFSIDEKKARADYIIDNSSDLINLQEECERFVEAIKTKYCL